MAKYSLMPDQQKLVEEHLYLVEIAVKQPVIDNKDLTDVEYK